MFVVTSVGRWINSLYTTINPLSDYQEMTAFARRLTTRPWHTENRFTMLRMKRTLPPRMIWIMVVHSARPHSYVGYRWFTRRYPRSVDAVKKGNLIT